MNKYCFFVVLALLITACNKDGVIEPESDSYTNFRPITSVSSAYSTIVYEYTPAPGQFINETSTAGGMTESILTVEAACNWAQNRLDNHLYVSLGAFGGYIIVGFDHSISSSALPYDFVIEGNAYTTDIGGSNEPGIVWVMQDTNGNGIPDDTWYQLKGSADNSSETKYDYSVTYYRPDAAGMDVEWVDSEGNSGTVAYLQQFHRQDYYYPQWISADSYTLTGTCLPSSGTYSESTGIWSNNAFEWGYADNCGSDNVTIDNDDISGQLTGFKISNAITASGKAIALEFIDFIKVQCGVQANCGWLGEVSTEVFSIADYSLLIE